MTTEPTNEQLAEWIEQSFHVTDALFKETTERYFQFSGETDTFCGCALARAAIGKEGSVRGAHRAYVTVWSPKRAIGTMAQLLGISKERAVAIEDQHVIGKSAAEIAQMLRNNEI